MLDSITFFISLYGCLHLLLMAIAPPKLAPFAAYLNRLIILVIAVALAIHLAIDYGYLQISTY